MIVSRMNRRIRRVFNLRSPLPFRMNNRKERFLERQWASRIYFTKIKDRKTCASATPVLAVADFALVAMLAYPVNPIKP